MIYLSLYIFVISLYLSISFPNSVYNKSNLKMKSYIIKLFFNKINMQFIQGKGTLFRNIKNTGRSNYSALFSRQVPTNGWVPMS